MMKTSVFLISILFCSLLNVIGQNLVVNPSFEEFEGEVNLNRCQHPILKCKGWNIDTSLNNILCCGYFFLNKTESAKGEFKKHYSDFLYPKDSNGMVVISPGLDYWNHIKNIKKHKNLLSSSLGGFKLQGQLFAAMKKDSIYCVKFYYSITPSSWYPAEELAVYFYNNEQSVFDTDVKLDSSLSLSDSSLSISGQWHCFSKVYKAQGDEDRFLIGNFVLKDYSIQERLISGKKMKTGSHAGKKFYGWNFDYYMIDDVAIFPISGGQDCGCE